jgi:molybdopterin-binding protein
MITALLGPNGAGKSTYLRNKIGLHRERIEPGSAMVFQEPLLFDLSVKDNVALGLKFKKEKSIPQKVDHWLKFLQIEHLAHRRALTLSGGEAQKVALARALAMEPTILYLDEPFSNLDEVTRRELKTKLTALIRARGIQTIWVTHDKAEALTLADRLMIMLDFQIVQEDTPQAVIQKPATPEIARFLGVDNIFQGTLQTDNDRTFFQNDRVCFEVSGGSTDPGWVIVHPEDIILSPTPLSGTSARNSLRGRVDQLFATGLTYQVEIDAGERFHVAVTRAAIEELGIYPGATVYLTFKATAVHVL